MYTMIRLVPCPHPVACLLCCLLLAGCGKTPPPAEEAPHPAPVKAQAAQRVTLEEWTELLGTTQPLPRHAARITAAVEGRVLSVLGDAKGPPVREGQQVAAGQVIVQLDDTVQRANRDRL